jgi:sugar phosphate isomerase/epimerase
MINIGVRAHDFGKHLPEEIAEKVYSNGFSCIQLAMAKAFSNFDKLHHKLTPGYANRIRRIFNHRQIDIAVLGCYINPIHPDRMIREESLLRFEEHLRVARDFGCAIVATETGSRNPDCSYNPLTETEEAFLEFVSVIKRLSKTAENFGTIIGIEGVAHQHTINTHERMVRFLELVDSSNVQVVYDPVNFIPYDRCHDHEEHIKEAFELFGDRIVAIHAKDFDVADGKKRADLPSGKGKLNYPFFFELLEKKKPGIHVLLENNTPETMEASVNFVKSIGK